MTTTKTKTCLSAALALGGLLALATDAPGGPPKPPPEAKAPPDVVAVVGDVPVTAAELEEMGGGQLFTMRTQEYTLKRRFLDEAIARRLLEKEALARGIGVDELNRLEVEGKVAAVTEAEQRAFYEGNKARFGNTSEADALKQIEAGLRQQRLRERRSELVQGLRAKAGVKVLLDAPRAAVTAGDGPSKGPAGAPVTIVEFSDFQCPYCAQANAVVKRLEERYGGKIRIVFRDFPLLQIHKDAAKAAEAAACAHDQGKFWEMHDKLFANQAALQVEGLKSAAAEIGLDTEGFNQCLDSGRHTKDWQEDQADAARFGVTGTPAFFINGRLLVGAQPLEGFIQVIDEELERAKPLAPAPKTKG